MSFNQILFRLPAWTLGFLLAGMGFFNLFQQFDIVSGMRVPSITAVVIMSHLPLFVFSYPKTKQINYMVRSILLLCFVFLISMWAHDSASYGMWKFGGFLCLSVVPVYLIYKFYRGNNFLLISLYDSFIWFSLIPLMITTQAFQNYGFYGLKWNLLNVGVDIIGLSRSLGLGAIVYFIGIFYWKGAVKKWVAAVVVVLMVSGQLLLQERGPLLGSTLAFLFIYVLLFRNGQFGKAKLLRLALLASPMVILFSINLPFVMHRFASEIILQDARIDVLRFSLLTINKMNLIVGEGLGNFSFYGNSVGTRQFAHNVFIEIFLETGLLGLSVLIFVILLAIKDCIKVNQFTNIELTFRAFFVFCLINSQVSGDIVTNYMLFVSIMIFLCAKITDGNSKNLVIANNSTN